jgi:hypothetical protein
MPRSKRAKTRIRLSGKYSRKYNCILKLPGFWTAASNWMMLFINDKK